MTDGPSGPPGWLGGENYIKDVTVGMGAGFSETDSYHLPTESALFQL